MKKILIILFALIVHSTGSAFDPLIAKSTLSQLDDFQIQSWEDIDGTWQASSKAKGLYITITKDKIASLEPVTKERAEKALMRCYHLAVVATGANQDKRPAVADHIINTVKRGLKKTLFINNTMFEVNPLPLGDGVILACSISSMKETVADIEIPEFSGTSKNIRLVKDSWNKLLKSCPGLSKYSADLTFDGVNSNVGPVPSFMMYYKVSTDASPEVTRYGARRHRCGFGISNNGGYLVINKNVCVSICLAKEADDLSHNYVVELGVPNASPIPLDNWPIIWD